MQVLEHGGKRRGPAVKHVRAMCFATERPPVSSSQMMLPRRQEQTQVEILRQASMRPTPPGAVRRQAVWLHPTVPNSLPPDQPVGFPERGEDLPVPEGLPQAGQEVAVGDRDRSQPCALQSVSPRWRRRILPTRWMRPGDIGRKMRRSCSRVCRSLARDGSSTQWARLAWAGGHR